MCSFVVFFVPYRFEMYNPAEQYIYILGHHSVLYSIAIEVHALSNAE